MGSFFPGVPKEFTNFLKNLTGIETFVETGTYLGDSASWASKLFKSVFTIELSKELYNNAKLKLKEFSNITILNGNSADELVQITKSIKSPAIF